METQVKFLNTIFDQNQYTCFTSYPRGTSVSSVEQFCRQRPKWKRTNFFCINALDPHGDSNPTEDYHAADKPRRADHNIVCYRNFLIEIDDLPLTAQINYVLERIPLELITSITYSGGKSYHFLISLQTPLASIDDYRNVANRILKLVKMADHSCKNPSRLSRFPNSIREDNSVVQELKHLGQRVDNDALFALLPVYKEPLFTTPMHSSEFAKERVPKILEEAITAPNTQMHRIRIGGRKRYFFWLYGQMKLLNMSDFERRAIAEQVYSKLDDKSQFSLREALRICRVRG